MDREQIVSQLPKLMQRILERAEDTRYSLSWPGVAGDYICATDGRILARVHGTKVDDNVTQAIKDNVQRFPFPSVTTLPGWDGKGYSMAPILLDGFDLSDLTPRICQKCLGDPTGERECAECGSSYEWECPACDGAGKISPKPSPIEVAPGLWVKDCYVAMLAEAQAQLFAPPGAEQQPPPAIVRATPLRFTCPDGVEGLVMQTGGEAIGIIHLAAVVFMPRAEHGLERWLPGRRAGLYRPAQGGG